MNCIRRKKSKFFVPFDNDAKKILNYRIWNDNVQKQWIVLDFEKNFSTLIHHLTSTNDYLQLLLFLFRSLRNEQKEEQKPNKKKRLSYVSKKENDKNHIAAVHERKFIAVVGLWKRTFVSVFLCVSHLPHRKRDGTFLN